jgi:hypothetical protein
MQRTIGFWTDATSIEGIQLGGYPHLYAGIKFLQNVTRMNFHTNAWAQIKFESNPPNLKTIKRV